MAALSERARKRRLQDAQATAEQLDTVGFVAIVTMGLALILKHKMAKYTKGQRASLAFIALALGGTVIALLLYNHLEGFALVLMFVLGFAIASISRM